MRDCRARVKQNLDLGGDVRLLRMEAPGIAPGMAPGRFVMLSVDDGVDPLLRRPFSIQRVDGDSVDVLYRVVGRGTARMAALEPGDGLDVLGPLGTAFALPAPGETAVLLGGGVGIPPMVALAEALIARGHDAWQGYVGVAGQHDSGCWSGFQALVPADDPRLTRATMDGSIGFEGHVVAAWRDRWTRERPEGPVRVYACGPMVMLRAVRDEAARLGLPCQVSVEQVMGCGLGICTGCVVENARWDGSNPYERWLLACKEGPVFDADQVVLSGGPHG